MEKYENRKIISFFELPKIWQKEAKENLGQDIAKEILYLEPLENQNPNEHILWDLMEAIPYEGKHENFVYTHTIAISNNSGMLLDIDINLTEAKIKFI